jgi:hypothetical protein
MTDEPTHQIGVDELRTLDADAIRDALRAGRLDQLLSGHDPGPPPDPNQKDGDGFLDRYLGMGRDEKGSRPDEETRQFGRDDLKTMSETEIAAALENGQLDELLGRR